MSLLFNDIESKEDFLGYESYIQAFKYIINKGDEYFDTPLVIGIHGKWGSGKSTFMNLLVREIDPYFFGDKKKEEKKDVEKQNQKNKYKIIKINSWQFDGKMDFINILFLEFFKSIRDDSLFSDRKELRIKFRDFFKSLGGDVTLKLKGGFSEVGASIKKDCNREGLFERDKIFLQKDLIEEIIEDQYFKDNKFIIFIDDLDRCKHENILNILEEIKLTLNSLRCIFILGSDLDYLKSAVAVKYRDIIEYKSKIKGNDDEIEDEIINFCNEYLEKIVQIPFNIPNIDINDMQKFLENLIIDSKNNKNIRYHDFYNKIEELIETDRMRFGQELEIISEFFMKLRISARKVKRIINQVLMHNIFIHFNRVKNNELENKFNTDLTILTLLVVLKNIDSKYYNDRFWSSDIAKSTIEVWNSEIQESFIDETETPKDILNFLKGLVQKRSLKTIEIEDNELKNYLDITNTINFRDVEPSYFKIKSNTRTNKKVGDFCEQNRHNKQLMALVRYFFENIYKSDKHDIGISSNLMIYTKEERSYGERFLYAFIGGMQQENSYLKLRYRNFKSVCCVDGEEESIVINKKNNSKIIEIVNRGITYEHRGN
ncbi:KAP family NTPase [Clostridium sp. LY3-2]|uniref:KAP family P-loop NTPase fold protein n=1 Tax=Clostridium sp. LY3-2 TaxID=2942482 RepID=UPI0021525926|nr:KAP family NTPase [Clostridium sp. LY3-2]MCR6514272.1 KAP family NTPase [Clostridium sp. LY3-2]